MVALSDSHGGIYQEKGFDVATILDSISEAKKQHKSLEDLEGDFAKVGNEELLELEVDLLVPAEIGGVIDERNAQKIKAAMIIEGANMPVTCSADAMLRDRGIVAVPDILANAGGVTASYLEWVQNRQGYRWSKQKLFLQPEESPVASLGNGRGAMRRRRFQLPESRLRDFRRANHQGDRVARLLTRRILPRSGETLWEPLSASSIFVADIWGIVQAVKSAASAGWKVLWVVLILVLPVFGLLLWYFLGPRQARGRSVRAPAAVFFSVNPMCLLDSFYVCPTLE